MAGLLGGLINASKSLAAAEAGAQTAGRNLANVNNPNYSRQRVSLGSKVVIDTKMGPAGTGVEALGVQQIRSSILDGSVTREISQSSSLIARQSALERAEANLGESINSSANTGSISDAAGATNGISSAINSFFNSWEELSARPADSATRQLALQKASTLADKLNVTDQRLSALQEDLTTQIENDVTATNSVLQSIADLNTKIAQVEVGAPGAALELRDQRQAKLEELAQYMDFTSRDIPGGLGQIQVVAKDANGAEVNLVSKNIVKPLSFDGTGFGSGNPATPISISGGSLEGTLQARDGTVQTLRDRLSALGQQLTTSVNSAYNPGGVGEDFFSTPGAGSLLSVNSNLTAANLQTGTTGGAGSNDLALAISALANQKFSTANGDAINGSASGFLADTISGLGGALRDVNSKLEDQELVQTMITQQRDQVSGVSMDEELAELMKFQRAFQANSKVLSTIDQMLGDLINSIGR